MTLHCRRANWSVNLPGNTSARLLWTAKGSTILQQHLFECAKGCSLHLLADTQAIARSTSAFMNRANDAFAQLVVKGLVEKPDGHQPVAGIEMMVQSSDTIDLVATKCPRKVAVTSMAGVMARLRKQNWRHGQCGRVRQERKLLKIVVGIDNGRFVRGGLFGDKIGSQSEGGGIGWWILLLKILYAES